MKVVLVPFEFFMIDKNYKVWAEHSEDNSVKAVISSLKLYHSRWIRVSSYEDAALWCVSSDVDDVKTIWEHYRSIPAPKPEVVFLASEFKPMEGSRWVFFKTPLNVRVFHRWLRAKGFLSEHDVFNATDASANVQEFVHARWKKESFRIRHWPNVTQYSNSPNLVVMCSMMMHEWCSYSKLIPFNIEQKILEKLLADAEQGGNLIYRDKVEEGYHQGGSADKTPPVSKALRKKGLFRRLFDKFTA